MRKRKELLVCLMILTLAGNPMAVYGSENHDLDEGTVIAQSCTEKGYTLYRCRDKDCDYEERKEEKASLGHELKEVSRTEAEGENPGYILYECQRENCDYQVRTEITRDGSEPGKPSEDTPSIQDPGEDSQTPEPGKDPSETGKDPDSEETKSEPGESKPGSEEPKSDPEKTTSENTENQSGEKETKENPGEEASQTPEAEDSTQKAEELPEIDPDSEGEAMTWASATSTDIVSEYDPETASDTIEVPADASHPEKVTEVEGRTVPEGTARVTRDSDGHITDVEFSMELVEMKYGVSFTSEAEKLESVTLTDLNNEKNFRITLKAKKAAGELGIRLTETEKGTLIVLTENKKELHIVKAAEKDRKSVFTTSSGGSFEISRENKEFSVPLMHISGKDINRILLSGLKEQKPAVKFLSSGKLSTKEREQEENLREKPYWIRPYGDPNREPVVIKIYEKSNAY